MCATALATQAQTLVNRAWKTTTGNPVRTYDHIAGAQAGNFVILVGNNYAAGQEENYLITRYTFTGQIVWQTQYNSPGNYTDLGFDVCIKGNYVYVTGAVVDSASANSDIATIMLTADSGHIVWDTTYAGTYGGLDVAMGIAADSAGNAYVLGTEQTGMADTKMTVIKYNAAGQQLWKMHYDSLGYIDGAGALQVSDTSLLITGFSGTTGLNWHFVVLTASANIGAVSAIRRDANGNGSFNQVYSIAQDFAGNTYIAGSSKLSSTNTDIKIISYDNQLNQRWVKTWGSPDSLVDEPCKILLDGAGDMMVAGYSYKANGGSDMLLLRINEADGALLWQQRISAANPAHECKARDMISAPLGSGGPVYITGYTGNIGYRDFITTCYGTDGSLKWLRTLNDTLDSNDEAKDIQYTSGGVIVSGISSRAGVNKYVSVKYEELNKTNTTIMDTAGEPMYMDNQAIIMFDKSVLSADFVNDREQWFAKPDKVFTPAAYTYFLAKMPSPFGRCNLVKIFPELTTADTLMITRLGDTIYAPPFYNAMQLVCAGNISEQAICDTLNRSYPKVKYAYPNYVAKVYSDIPNDELFISSQSGLGDIAANYGSINVLPAWDLETGNPSIRVGIIDDAVDGFHEDFGGTDSTFMLGKVQGWDFQNNMDLLTNKRLPPPYLVTQIPWYRSHGTEMAGIVGALRNNGIGIAGVAGGDMGIGNPGVSIYNPRVFNAVRGNDSLYWFDGLAIARGIFLSALQGDSSDGILYKYGLHVMNNSYGQGYMTGPFPLNYSKLHLLRDAVHAVNRLGVVFIAARGQDDSNNFIYPGCYNDDWVLTISGTKGDGYWNDDHISPHDVGGPIDIAAPSYRGATTTMVYNLSDHISSYSNPNLVSGTSVSTAYTTGVSALLLSYYNPNHDQTQGLVHEDVEYILENTATPTGEPTRFIGSGRLNAAEAIYMIHQPERTVRHVRGGAASAILSDTMLLLETGVLVRINEPITSFGQESNYNDTLISSIPDTGLYKMDVYKYSGWVKHSIPAADSIVGYWALPSLSNPWNKIAVDTLTNVKYLQPYEKVYIDSITRDSALLSGYYYKVYAAHNDSFITWLPDDGKNPIVSYSLLTNDNSYIPTSINEPAKIKTWLYPNPTQETSYLSIVADKEEQATVRMYDITGRIVKDIYSGNIDKIKNFEIYISDLQRGMYIITIETRAESKSLKISKL